MSIAQHFTDAREAALRSGKPNAETGGAREAVLRSASSRAETTGEFGPASDAVSAPITVLTTDTELYESVRRAVREQHPVSLAADLEQAAELAAAGKCAILITDQATTAVASGHITEHLRKHEPALVCIAVGNRGQDSVLLGLMSASVVDRFMLKPLTPALARIVIEAAEKEHQARKPCQRSQPRPEQAAAVTMQRTPPAMRKRERARERTDITQPVRTLPSPPAPVEAIPEVVAHEEEQLEDQTVVVPTLDALSPTLQSGHADTEAEYTDLPSSASSAQDMAAPTSAPEQPAAWLESAHPAPDLASSAFQEPSIPRPSWMVLIAAVIAVGGLVWWIMSQRLPDIDPRQLIESNLSAAQAAFEEKRYFEPSDRSAFHYFNTVIALDPANATAQAGIGRIADHFVGYADTLIAEGRYAEAVNALQNVRRVHPGHARVAPLEAQLRERLERQFPQIRKPRARDPQPAEIAAAVQRANASKTPAPDASATRPDASAIRSARVDERPAAPREESFDAPMQQDAGGSQTRVIADAHQAIDRGEFDVARTLLNAALEMGAAPRDLMSLDQALATAEQRLAKAQPSPVDVAETAPRSEPAPAPAVAAVPPPEPSAEPVLIRVVQPQYPGEARLRGIEGWVDLSFTVSAAGDVTEPRVEDSSMKHLFARPALTAVRQWRYQPRTVVDPSQRTRVRMQFRLKD